MSQSTMSRTPWLAALQQAGARLAGQVPRLPWRRRPPAAADASAKQAKAPAAPNPALASTPATRAACVADYFAEVDSWAHDKYDQALCWQYRCLAIALGASLLCGLLILTLFRVLPLKTTEPYLVMLHETTGEPVLMRPINSQTVLENQALQHYMLSKFIQAFERFDEKTLAHDADTVRVLASPAVYHDYRERLRRSDNTNPLNRFKDAKREIAVKQIVFLNPERALVFFTAITRSKAHTITEQLTADIGFHFTEKTLTQAEAQGINPVNFEVTGISFSEVMTPAQPPLTDGA